MKRVLSCLVVGALATGLACDTEEPTQRKEANVLVTLKTTGSSFASFRYNVYFGNPAEPPPKQQFFKAECVLVADQGTGTPVVIPGVDMPWPVAVEISVIKAGTPDSETIATTLDGLSIPGTVERFNTITGYDPLTPDLGIAVPPKPPQGNRYFADGMVISNSGREYYERCTTVLPDTPPAGFPFEDYGPVQVINQTIGSPTYSLKLAKGDTLVVKAQKIADDSAPIRYGRDVQLSAEVLVEGVTDPITATSSTASGAGVVLAYTLP